MLKTYLNWKMFLVVVAVFIAVISLYYANNLTKKLAIEERKKVQAMGLAFEEILQSKEGDIYNLASSLISENTTIPVIFADKNGNILDSKNIDSVNNKVLMREKLLELKKSHEPIEYAVNSRERQFIYYGESELLTQLRYFPYVLLVILFLFLIIVASFINSTGRQMQDRVWVGMSKETAHQLGTPLTSLVAWIEYLKESEVEKPALIEMQKDVARLQLIADRFSKIGSVPQLEEEFLLDHLQAIVEYMQKRASRNVKFSIHSNKPDVLVVISGPLFDWVIENLIRNALDAMDGQGSISIHVMDEITRTKIDITDTGKGIAPKNIRKVFKPGFSTKKRGWGLGLSLSKRIISEYHHGELFVKRSEPGKGTTFRIILKR
ncbi:MAG: HAMP domain-containing histidine kinase [Chitinophagaceae bacterium]|nr:HAMP domain-containing histidine kinase [Chitinophagaceae bacterium]